jgi:hypothetical protein
VSARLGIATTAVVDEAATMAAVRASTVQVLRVSTFHPSPQPTARPTAQPLVGTLVAAAVDAVNDPTATPNILAFVGAGAALAFLVGVGFALKRQREVAVAMKKVAPFGPAASPMAEAGLSHQTTAIAETRGETKEESGGAVPRATAERLARTTSRLERMAAFFRSRGQVTPFF